MGKLSFHVQHFKATQVSGLDKHNRRLYDRHSNTEIVNELKKDNVVLVPVRESLYQDAKNKIEKEVIAKGNRVTKASIWISEAILTLPDGINTGQSKEYFESVVEFFQGKFEAGNVVSAIIHMDESTPHMHIDFTNITREGKLSRKEIWTKTELCKIHDDLPTFLKNKGFNVERGEKLENYSDKQKAAMNIKEYKAYKEKEKAIEQYKNVVQEHNNIVDDIKKLQEIKKSVSVNCLKTAYKLIEKTQDERGL